MDGESASGVPVLKYDTDVCSPQVFGTTNILGMIFVFFLPETKDVGLEEMDIIFGVVDENTRRRDIEMNLDDKARMATVNSDDKQGPSDGVRSI